MLYRKYLIPILLLSLISLLYFSCSKSDDKGIETSLLNRKKAYETKDAELYKNVVYGNDKNVTESFNNVISVFDEINMEEYDRTININNGNAEVIQTTVFKLRINENRSKFTRRERIILEKIDNNWKLIKDSEVDFFDGFVYGNTK